MTPEQLKASILQYAMEGKLVKQDPNDEPASELLKKIEAEKVKLIRENKIKQTKKIPEISQEEIPFEIPESWEWTRFGDLVHFNLGKTPKRTVTEYWINGQIPWISIADMKSPSLSKTEEKITKQAFKDVFKNKLVPKGTLLMSFKLSIGKVGILKTDAVHNEAIIDIYPYMNDQNVTRNYLFTFLPLISNAGKFNNAIKGKTLNKASMTKLLIPLPPFEEQKRIVAKIEQLLPLIDKYAEAYNRLKEIDDAFNDKMKQSILQYAMEGKLVKQDHNDEPASELLKKIKVEKAQLIKEKKIKATKKLPEITQEEIPFETSDGWEWTRLGNVSNYIQRGRSPQYSNTKTEHRVISQKCIQWEEITLEKAKYINNTFFDKLENYRFVKKDDLLWCSTGTGTVGRINIVTNEFNNTPVDSHVTIVRSNSYVNSKFIFYFLISAHIQNNLNSLLTGSTKQKELGLSTIQHIVIPLPPLDEQKRIVAKIDSLFQKL
ncbi:MULTISPECIES: restriction endonuclease subunit S [Lactobacillales]|uniref:Restriction endonuclease subunit S n=2 Tax=Companilactobacillus futsaii TaxID=938155 RepID=A0A5B7T2M4_9LACO|nr:MULTISPECIES: restriction endonuclease subunit S [Lactobacillaceae]AYA98409.1 restriction endonuclease subunit S [Lactiplantibacillus plantarum]AYA98431.1 restriction endonuclease subunit S [Lactiplantibacillus plantarum]AYG36413.1 restriction endonuclease subunit S [Lactiplantibacillus plantarum]KRK95242.1 type i site-specific deoxyribonuclease chain s [Companilactobacillus futsaii JCM 17355]QCX26087.1 restriction endonuclease subunit S [Companilactobacillus futsaii]